MYSTCRVSELCVVFVDAVAHNSDLAVLDNIYRVACTFVKVLYVN